MTASGLKLEHVRHSRKKSEGLHGSDATRDLVTEADSVERNHHPVPANEISVVERGRGPLVSVPGPAENRHAAQGLPVSQRLPG
jgi:hypothetical protein